jgi:hypothetical protein
MKAIKSRMMYGRGTWPVLGRREVPEERHDSDDEAIDGRVVMGPNEVEWKSLTVFEK